MVVALLAAGLFGGLAVERWRARHPVIADRLEAEPARPPTAVPAQSAPRFRPRQRRGPLRGAGDPREPARLD